MTDPAPGSATHKKSRLSNVLQTAFGLAVSALCVFLVLQKVSLDDLASRIASIQWWLLVLSLASLTVGYLLRIVRWKVMLEAGDVRVGLGACVPPFLGAITMNNVLPLRSGDVLRALVFPTSIGVGRVLSMTSLLFEKALDIFVLCIAIVAGVFLTLEFHYPEWVLSTVVVLGSGLLFGILVVALLGGPVSRWLKLHSVEGADESVGLKHKLFSVASDSLDVALKIASPLTTVKLTSISVAAWLLEAGAFYFVFLAMGIPNFAAYAVIVMSVGTLSTLIPSSPGYVGPFHLAVSSLLVAFGLDAASATGYAVVVHLVLWLPTTLAGVVCIAFNPELFKTSSKRKR